MAKKNVLCPSCSNVLIGLNSDGFCKGTVIKCSVCGASVLVEADASGRMKLNVEPDDKPISAK